MLRRECLVLISLSPPLYIQVRLPSHPDVILLMPCSFGKPNIFGVAFDRTTHMMCQMPSETVWCEIR